MKRQVSGDNLTKEFVDCFESLCYSRNRWDIWSNFIFLFAAMISLAVDRNQTEERTKEYNRILSSYSAKEQEMLQQMTALTVLALEKNPEQDFLGTLYMRLNLANKHRGQEFTPYNISKMMAQMQALNAKDVVAEKGWMSIGDPACGACGMLIAFRNEMVRQHIPFQNVLFVGQDIDFTAALMGYIQISLLGCAGYIIIGDALTNPAVGSSPLLPQVQEGQQIWYTPMFFDSVWHARRIMAYLAGML